MANLAAAKKHIRQTKKRRIVNLNRQSRIKTTIKKLLKAIDSKESPEAINLLFNDAQAQLARAQSKGLIHSKTASRKVSRLAQHITKSAV